MLVSRGGLKCWITPSLHCDKGDCTDCQVYIDSKYNLCEKCGADIGVWEEVFSRKHYCPDTLVEAQLDEILLNHKEG